MKSRFVNPFIKAAVYTFHQFFPDIVVNHGSPAIISELPQQQGIAADLRFFGELDGRVIYFMEEITCLDIVGELNEKQVEEINELALSTVRELANIITGQSAIRLENENCQVDISTPRLHSGNPGECLELEAEKILYFPLHTSYGDVKIHLIFD